MGLSKPADEILTEGTLGANETATTSQVDLSDSSHFTITIRADLGAGTNAGLACYLRSSPDGSLWDTQNVGWNESGNFDFPSDFNSTIHAGQTLQKTVPINEVFKYIRVHVENDGTVAANNVSVTAAKQEVAPY